MAAIECVDLDTGAVYRSPDGKQWPGVERQVSSVETVAARLAAEGEMLRRCRTKLIAAQRDVAEAACMTHTTLGEIENGYATSDTHIPRVKKALLRIAAQRFKLMSEAIEELLA